MFVLGKRQLPLRRFPSASFKSWPRFLGNLWIKKRSFDTIIAPACPRHCNGPRLFNYSFGGNTWLSECVEMLCISQFPNAWFWNRSWKRKRVRLWGHMTWRPRSWADRVRCRTSVSRKCEWNQEEKVCARVLSAQKVPGRFLSHRSGCLLRSVGGSSSESSGNAEKPESKLPPHCPFKGGWAGCVSSPSLRYAKSCWYERNRFWLGLCSTIRDEMSNWAETFFLGVGALGCSWNVLPIDSKTTFQTRALARPVKACIDFLESSVACYPRNKAKNMIVSEMASSSCINSANSLTTEPFSGHTHVVLEKRQLPPRRFPSASFKSWPRFLGNLWIKKRSFDTIIAPACPRHCNGPRLFNYSFGGNTWLSECVEMLCISQFPNAWFWNRSWKRKRVRLWGHMTWRPRSWADRVRCRTSVSRKCEWNQEEKVCARVLSAQKVPGRCLSHRSGCLLRSVGGSSSESSGMLKNQSPSCRLIVRSRVDGLDAFLHHHWGMRSLVDMKETVSDWVCAAPFEMKCQIELRPFSWA